MTNKPVLPTQPQVDKFKAMAREVGSDAPENLFDQMMRKLAGPPQPGRKKPGRR